MLKVAIVGLGQMGRNHLRVASDNASVEVSVIVDPMVNNPPMGVPVIDNLDDLSDIDVDCAIVASPSDTHSDIGLSLAKIGVPSLIEKPLSLSVRDAEVLQEAFTLNRVPCFVGFVERFNPAIGAIKQVIDDGDLGPLRAIHSERHSPNYSRMIGSSVIDDLGSHDIDLAMYLSDSKFFSAAGEVLGEHTKGHNHYVATCGMLESGVAHSLTASWLFPRKVRRTTCVFELGVAVADTLNETLEISLYPDAQIKSTQLHQGTLADSELSWSFRGSLKEPLKLEQDAFFSAVEGYSSENLANVEDGLQVARVSEAISSEQRSSALS